MFGFKLRTHRAPQTAVWRKGFPHRWKQVHCGSTMPLEGLTDADERYIRAGTWRHIARQECERLARRALNPAMRNVRKTAEALQDKEVVGRTLHGLQSKTPRRPGLVMA